MITLQRNVLLSLYSLFITRESRLTREAKVRVCFHIGYMSWIILFISMVSALHVTLFGFYCMLLFPYLTGFAGFRCT